MGIYITIGITVYLYLLFTSTIIYSRTHKLVVVKYFNKLYVIMFFLFLALFSILRGLNVGTDYKMYNYFFLNRNYNDYFDMGIVIIYNISVFFKNFQLFTIICTLLFLYFTFRLIKKYSYNIITALSLFILSYFYYLILNQTRQAIAIIILWIGLLAFSNNRKRGILVFIPSVIIAAQFHYSAYLTLGFLFLNFIKVNRRFLLIGFIIVIFGYFTDIIRSIVSPILTNLTFYEAKYSSDLSQFFGKNKEKGFLQFLPVMIQFILFYIWLGYKKTNVTEKKNSITLIETYYFFYLILYCVAGIEATDRFQIYLYPSIIFFYDMFIYYIMGQPVRNKKESLFRIALFIIIITFWLIYYLLRVIQNTNGIIPYLLW
jgi:EpsG family